MQQRTVIDALSDLREVTSQGDMRRIVGNCLLGLVRKEISSTDVEALAKGLDAISNSLNAEVRVARASIELRAQGADLSKLNRP